MKIKLFLLLIIIFLIVCGCNSSNLNENENNTINFISKCSFRDGEDGWFKYLCIDVSKKNKNINIIEDNYIFDDKVTYVFDGINLKYQSIENYYIPIYDEEKNEIGRLSSNYPSLSISKELKDEIKEINTYFNKYKFKNKITIDDLKSLNLTFINVHELIDMFNEAIENNPKKLGKYINLPFVSIKQSLNEGGFKYQVGYYLEYGNIRKVDLEVIIEKDSQKVNSDKKYKKLKEDLKLFEKYILQYQTFDISGCDIYSEDYQLLYNLLLGLENEK